MFFFLGGGSTYCSIAFFLPRDAKRSVSCYSLLLPVRVCSMFCIFVCCGFCSMDPATGSDYQ